MRHVLAIDPSGKGGDTGIVLFGYDDDTPAYLVSSWAVRGELNGFMEWWQNFEQPEGLSVVYEHFVNRNVRGADLTPCFIEGAIVAMCWLDGIPSHPSPAAGKNTAITDTVLKANDLWFPGDHHHDRREASRHGLWWLKKRGHKPTLLRLYPV